MAGEERRLAHSLYLYSMGEIRREHLTTEWKANKDRGGNIGALAKMIGAIKHRGPLGEDCANRLTRTLDYHATEGNPLPEGSSRSYWHYWLTVALAGRIEFKSQGQYLHSACGDLIKRMLTWSKMHLRDGQVVFPGPRSWFKEEFSSRMILLSQTPTEAQLGLDSYVLPASMWKRVNDFALSSLPESTVVPHHLWSSGAKSLLSMFELIEKPWDNPCLAVVWSERVGWRRLQAHGREVPGPVQVVGSQQQVWPTGDCRSLLNLPQGAVIAAITGAFGGPPEGVGKLTSPQTVHPVIPLPTNLSPSPGQPVDRGGIDWGNIDAHAYALNVWIDRKDKEQVEYHASSIVTLVRQDS